MNRQNVAVIGSGAGGLASAIRLAVKGYQVTIWEANSYPGGKLSETKVDGFRFDAGPSLFTMPQYVDELFELAGERPLEHFDYQQLDVICRYFYEDGTRLSAYADNQRFAEEVEANTGEPADHVMHALEKSKFLYDHLGDLFIRRPIHSLNTFVSKQAFRAYKSLLKLDFFRTMNQANEDMFQSPKVTQLFNRYATYNGSDPYKTPATMNIIPHLEFSKGAFFPKKGMHDITMSLYGLAKRLGVKFCFDSKVSKIEVKDKKAVGIWTQGELKTYDAIVTNMDVVNTYRKLLPEQKQPNFLLNQPKSSSALIFYWGIKREFKELDLHNIFFSDDYKAEFDYIFNRSDVYNDPTVYVNITSKYKKDDAPDASENWFTMINVPNNSGQDWEDIVDRARQHIVDKLSRILGVSIQDQIVCEAVLDPVT
ncbi:MAG: 1-hydroxycarotenoid 3,4-desaturase CrtD, partial [Bacteroidota bacterium]